MRRYGLYVFDLDGTLYRGAEPLPHAIEVVSQLVESGARVRYLTNNSSRTPLEQAGKLRQMGFPAYPEHVLTSGVGAARYLVERQRKRVFVVGERGLCQVLEDAGLELVGADEPADAVLSGICLGFTYAWLNEAMQHILLGAEFIATNTDSSYPVEGGRLIPGSGAIAAAISTCTGVQPFVVGKPNPFLVQMLLDEVGCAAGESIVVGDRYETDILAGLAAGCDTLQVMTGVAGTAPEGTAWAEDLSVLLD